MGSVGKAAGSGSGGKRWQLPPAKGLPLLCPPPGRLSLLPAWLPQGYIPPGHGPRPSSDASGPMALVLEPCAPSQPQPGPGAGLPPPAQPCCHAGSPVLARP